MVKLLVIVLALGFVSADGDLGYHYNVPHTSYGVPSYQVSGNVANDNKNYNYQNAAQVGVGQQSSGIYSGANSYPAAASIPSSGYHTGYQPVYSTGSQQANVQGIGSQYSNVVGTGSQYSKNVGTGSQYLSSLGTGNQQYQSGASSGSRVIASAVQPSLQFGAAPAQGEYTAYNQYQQSSAVHNYKEYHNLIQQQPAQVFKHFYVHAAPEEPEAPKFRQPISVPPPQKHYQIIFIKAPTQAAVAPQYIPVPQQKEEKTLVYVLVNKPEEQQEVVVPKVEPTPPNKPEVFFIKYNNKEGSQAVINNIVNDYSKGNSVSVSSSGAFTGESAGQQSQGVSSSQYTQTTGNDHYVTSVGTDLNQKGGSTGHYTVSSDSVVGIGSGQYTQTGESSQSTQSVGSDHYAGSSGLYTQTSGLEQYGTPLADTLDGTFSQVSVAQGGNQATSGSNSDGQVLNVVTSDSGISGSGTFANVNAIGSSNNYENQAGSSQGLPHETYGPPKFRA